MNIDLPRNLFRNIDTSFRNQGERRRRVKTGKWRGKKGGEGPTENLK